MFLNGNCSASESHLIPPIGGFFLLLFFRVYPMKTSEILSDQNLERTFITSAIAGVGLGLFVPVLLPVALTGMIGSQALFWGKHLSSPKDS